MKGMILAYYTPNKQRPINEAPKVHTLIQQSASFDAYVIRGVEQFRKSKQHTIYHSILSYVNGVFECTSGN